MSKCNSCGADITFLLAIVGKGWVAVNTESLNDKDEKEFDPVSGHINHRTTCRAPVKTEPLQRYERPGYL